MINFSVIIPNYNHAEFLEQRIDSVLKQSLPPYEVIILDDGSTDQSARILESYANHPLISRIILNNKNSGSPFIQWAKGIRMATAGWIWIAESDDVADTGSSAKSNNK
jgi:glycosyltransferase involved in cell wall biosynthesis